MNLLKSNDSITEASSLIALSSMPFFALGQLGAEIPFWIANILGGAALLIFVIRLLMVIFGVAKPSKNPSIEYGVKFTIGFAIPMGVTEAIVEYAHQASSLENYWFFGLLLLLGIAIMFVPYRMGS